MEAARYFTALIYLKIPTQLFPHLSTLARYTARNQIDHWLSASGPQETNIMNAKKLFQKVVGVSVLVGVLLSTNVSAVYAAPTAAATSSLTADEIAGLQFMREEEKLAHDVYVTFYQQYGLTIFNNITSSEATHMAAVKTLLDRYGIADPATGQPIGVFTNPRVEALYNQLIAQGRYSLNAAAESGRGHRRDRHPRFADTAGCDHAGRYQAQVYTNLMNGSYSHLRAFTRMLTNQTGETYRPQYLSAATYQGIINGGTGWRGGRRLNPACECTDSASYVAESVCFALKLLLAHALFDRQSGALPARHAAAQIETV